MQINTTEDLGEFIKELRKKQGIRQADLAELAKVSTKFIIGVEKGKKTSQIGKIINVINAIGIKLNLGK
ncbi:MAG: helix-turn-helix domain-containing protein [Alphaproteobacteria bacterium]|nr:MAG: hypothetical protein B6I23_00020 [Rickettsiaceae bacterium 4572_127]